MQLGVRGAFTDAIGWGVYALTGRSKESIVVYGDGVRAKLPGLLNTVDLFGPGADLSGLAPGLAAYDSLTSCCVTDSRADNPLCAAVTRDAATERIEDGFPVDRHRAAPGWRVADGVIRAAQLGWSRIGGVSDSAVGSDGVIAAPPRRATRAPSTPSSTPATSSGAAMACRPR